MYTRNRQTSTTRRLPLVTQATLLYQGEHTFSLQEQPDIRVVFSVEGDRAESVTIHQDGRSFTGARQH